MSDASSAASDWSTDSDDDGRKPTKGTAAAADDDKKKRARERKEKRAKKNMATTMADLRRDDAAWAPLPTDGQRQHVTGLIFRQIPYFASKLLLVGARESVASYTRRFLAHPKQEAYGWSLDFDTEAYCLLAHEGFITTGQELPAGRGEPPIQMLLPWIDPERNMLDFAAVHVPKQVRKRGKQYTLTTDAAFDDVVLQCVRQHGEAWLYRGLRWLLRRVFAGGVKRDADGVNVGVHTFELWDSDGRLVAGDLGYTTGAVYTSMTGFRLEGTNGAGSVQMVATAALLRRMGYRWWDLGMVMDYKKAMGAEVVTRDAFLTRLHADRGCMATAFGADGRVSAGELIAELVAWQAAQPKKPAA
jgi:leucyl/phenylalanyl-tRNA--protein transferase